MSPTEGSKASEAPTVLVVVAHPDDETFGCGSLLLHAAARGARTIVICATRGEAGELCEGVEAPQGIGNLREAELRSAADALGVAEVVVLDFEDSGMDGDPGPRTLSGAAPAEIRRALQPWIDRFEPDLVITLDGGDGHRDHQRLREVVESLIDTGTTPLYLHALPRSLMHAWVKHHAGDVDASVYTELPEIGTPDDLITTVIDTRSCRDARDEAIALHRSQRSPFADLSERLRDAFLNTDHLVRVGAGRTQELERELPVLAVAGARGTGDC